MGQSQVPGLPPRRQTCETSPPFFSATVHAKGRWWRRASRALRPLGLCLAPSTALVESRAFPAAVSVARKATVKPSVRDSHVRHTHRLPTSGDAVSTDETETTPSPATTFAHASTACLLERLARRTREVQLRPDVVHVEPPPMRGSPPPPRPRQPHKTLPATTAPSRRVRKIPYKIGTVCCIDLRLGPVGQQKARSPSPRGPGTPSSPPASGTPRPAPHVREELGLHRDTAPLFPSSYLLLAAFPRVPRLDLALISTNRSSKLVGGGKRRRKATRFG